MVRAKGIRTGWIRTGSSRAAWVRAGFLSWVAASSLALATALATPARAEDDGWITASSTPFQFGLAPGKGQIFSSATPVHGFRFTGLYGIQSKVVGLDFGLFNDAESMTGLGTGLCNVTRKSAMGAQLVVGCNYVEEDFVGVQTGVLFNHVGGEFVGAQAGLGNFVDKGKGVQIGLVNLSDSLKGVQFGLINVNRTGLLPFFPFINVGF